MSEWKETTVDQICKVKGGKRLPAGKEFAEGVTPFPYLRVTDMINGSIDQTSLVYVKPEIEPFIRNYKISKDNLYVTIAGTLGLFGTIPENLDNAQLTENAAKLCEVDFSEFNKDFLKYYFNSENIQTQIRREIGVGGGVPKLALFRIEKLKIKYPEKNIQDRIAHILSTCDAVIEKTQAAIDKYKAIKQGMLHDLFTRGIDPATGKLRPKYEDAPALYKESKLGMVPKEWDTKSLSSSAEIISGGTPPTHNKDFWNGHIPWLSVDDFNNGNRYVDKSAKHITEEGLKNSATNLLQKGMIIISARGTVGVISQLGTTMAFNQSCYGLNSINTKITNDFIYYFLIQYKTQYGFNSFGSVFGTITRDYFDSIEIAYPTDKNEANTIVEILSLIDNKLETEQTYLYKLQQIKAGLMSDLLSGRKLVTVKEGQMV